MAKCRQYVKDYIDSPAKFELGPKIGFGSSSIVYKGRYKFLDVAIKKIALSEALPKQIRHLINEMVLLARLRHPNIISLQGVCIDEQRNLFLITELQSKNSLRSFI